MKLLIVFLLIFFVSAQDCQSDSNCPTLNTCQDGQCQHKQFWPLQLQQYIGVFLVFIIASLCNAGGIGGGPIMIPIMLILFGFTAKVSVAMIQPIIFGGSLMSSSMKVFMRHPTKNRPLIFYSFLMHAQSPMLLGTTFGVMLNEMFPEWLIFILLTILLVYLTTSTGYKAKKFYQKESQENRNASGVKIQIQRDTKSAERLNLDQTKIQVQQKLKKILDYQAKKIEIVPVLVLAGIILLVILAAFMRGSKTLDSIIGISLCSGAFWGFLVCFVLLMIGINVCTSFYLYKHTKDREQIGYEFDEFDIRWKPKTIIVISVLALIAGLLAGTVGVGGGLVMGPILLFLGIRPQVTAASSSMMIMFTSSVAMVLFISIGILDLAYGTLLLLVSIIGACIGIILLKKLVDKYKRASLIVIILALMLGIAMVIVPVYGVIKMVQQEEDGTAEYGFSSMC